MEDLDRWVCSCASLSRAPPLSLFLSLHCLLLVCASVTAAPLLLSPLLLHPSIHTKQEGERVCVCACVRGRVSPLLLQSSMQLFLSVSELALQVPDLSMIIRRFSRKVLLLLVQTPTKSAYTRWRLLLVHLEQPGQRYENSCAGEHWRTVEYHKLKKESKESKITQTTLEEPEKDTTQHGKTRKRELLCVETCSSVWIRSSLTNAGKVTKYY